MNHECDVLPEDLGPYLLDQLPLEEAVLVERRVSACPSCTAEVARLRPVAAALAAAGDPHAVVPPPPPPGALERVLADVGRSRRRRTQRRALLAAAAVVVVASAALGAAALAEDEVQVLVLEGPGGARATARLSETDSGTALEVEARGLDPGTYGVWLADEDGGRLPAGSFRPGEDGAASVDLAAALPLGDSARIGISLVVPGQERLDVMTADLPGAAPG